MVTKWWENFLFWVNCFNNSFILYINTSFCLSSRLDLTWLYNNTSFCLSSRLDLTWLYNNTSFCFYNDGRMLCWTTFWHFLSGVCKSPCHDAEELRMVSRVVARWSKEPTSKFLWYTGLYMTLVPPSLALNISDSASAHKMIKLGP